MHVKNVTRRDLLKVGASTAALALLPRPLLARFGGPDWEPLPSIQDPKIKELAMRAITASKAAGATYADVRLTHTRERHARGGGTAYDAEEMHVGVRALIKGYWGFAASAVWTPEEMSRLAQAAVQQAKNNTLGKPRELEWTPAPAVKDGNWVMPVKRDPFDVSWGEIRDVLESMNAYAMRVPIKLINNIAKFVRQDQAFASTEGSYYTRRCYRSGGVFGVTPGPFDLTNPGAGDDAALGLDFLTPAGVGWELYTDHQPLEDEIRRLLEDIEREKKLVKIGLEVGRYDTVIDAWSVADLLTTTIGRATQIDRALGYEANGNGTSYLSDPAGMMGTYRTGADLLTVRGNRSEPGGAATVAWDDEGMQPEEFTLIENGMLTDFQTTREGAGWLAPAYRKLQRQVRSHGCAAAPSGWDAPLAHTPNLVMAPGKETQDFDTLVGGLKTGIALKFNGTMSDVDFQCLNGMARGRFYVVKNGRPAARIDANAGLLFRSPNLWEGLLAIGDARSMRRYGMPTDIPTGVLFPVSPHPESKGEPPQLTYHSVTAPPALFKQLTLIDVTRRQ